MRSRERNWGSRRTVEGDDFYLGIYFFILLIFVSNVFFVLKFEFEFEFIFNYRSCFGFYIIFVGSSLGKSGPWFRMSCVGLASTEKSGSRVKTRKISASCRVCGIVDQDRPTFNIFEPRLNFGFYFGILFNVSGKHSTIFVQIGYFANIIVKNNIIKKMQS